MPGFRCHTCGQWHVELPLDVGYDEPDTLCGLDEDQRSRDVTSDGDFRTWHDTDAGETHHFIRGVIEIPAPEIGDVFCYGVWTSLSAASYEQARAADRTNQSAGPFFGWLCNRLPGYPDTAGLKTNVHVRPDHKASIVLHRSTHPLHTEQRDGITLARVQQIVEPILHAGSRR